MLRLPLFDQVREVLCVGAHCDDVEIGCGGTLATLGRVNPQCRIHVVLLSGDARRAQESRNAIARLLPGLQPRVDVAGFRDGFFPAEWAGIKEHFEQLKSTCRPDLVLTHYGDDRHQDHRVVSELAWNTFRSATVLEYEIPKWDGDVGRPQVYVPLEREVVDMKVGTLMECFLSQLGRDWFTADLFSGLMRVRGMECHAPSGFAEAFHVRKLVVGQ